MSVTQVSPLTRYRYGSSLSHNARIFSSTCFLYIFQKTRAIGGRLIIPVGEGVQYMYRIERTAATEYQEDMLDAFRFVPFLEGLEKKK